MFWEGERDLLYITGIPLHDWWGHWDTCLCSPSSSALFFQLSHFAVPLTNTFLMQGKWQCMSEYYSNFIFCCSEFMKSTVSYLRSTSVKQLEDQSDKCCHRLQLSRGFSVWNLVLDSPQFPLSCKIACQGKTLKLNWAKLVSIRWGEQHCMGRERRKELPPHWDCYTLSLTSTVSTRADVKGTWLN